MVTSVIARTALVALSAALTIMTARGLGAVGRAIFAEASTAIYLAAALPSTGLGVANAYLAAGRSRRESLVANSLVASAAAIGLGALTLYVARIGGFLGSDWISAISVVIGVPLVTALALVNHILLGSRVLAYNAVLVLQPALLVAVYVGLLLTDHFTVETALLSLALSQCPALLLAIWWTIPRGQRGLRLRPDASLAKEALRYAGPAQFAGLVVYVNSRIGLYVVDPLAGRAEAGVFSVALVILDATSNLPQSLAVPLFADLARLGANSPEALARVSLISRVALVVVALLAVPLVAVTFLASSWLFGPGFAELPGVIALLIPAMLAMSLRSTSWAYLHGVGRPDLVVGPAMLGLLLNLMAGLTLVPRFGLLGASAAFSVSMTAMAFWLLRRHADLSGTGMHDLVLPRRSDGELLLARIRALTKLRTF